MSYTEAKKKYAALGVDTEKAIKELAKIPVSMHCWQGDDVTGFENAGALTGGIQSTGNYPGKARTPEELMADLELALKLIPGKHRVNLHACYAIFEDGKVVDRDKLEPKHFKKWVDFAKRNKIGLDFNPTFFSHMRDVTWQPDGNIVVSSLGNPGELNEIMSCVSAPMPANIELVHYDSNGNVIEYTNQNPFNV